MTIRRSTSDQESSNVAYLSLGSNLGDRKRYIQKAVEFLEQTPEILSLEVTPLLENPALLYLEQPPFLNCIALIETTLPPLELLELCKSIEKRVGRTPTFRYGPREIDLDILSFGNVRMETPLLTLPHPALADRSYLATLLLHFCLTPEDLL